MASRSLPIIPKQTYAQFTACVHCGLCLPACPTYAETSDEADSPRGRIHLMKALVDGRIEATDRVFDHLDGCLVCRACETACPSGVVYHELIEAVRPQVAETVLGKDKRGRSGTLQWMVENVLPYSGRAAAAMAPLKMARKAGLGAMAEKIARMMPGPLGAMAETMPPERAREAALPLFTPARGKCRGNVVLLRGCVGSVISGAVVGEGVNAACARVISENGFDVHLLANEPCCGAMAAHGNDPAGALNFARGMVDALAAKGGDYFVSPIAGCGAQLKQLGHWVEGERSGNIARRVRDVSEFLAEIDIRAPRGRVERTATYHDPCHLAHGQRVTAAPRQLLAMVPGLKLVALEESDMCCGAAGTYSLSQPEMAERLGRRKVGHILATGAQELVTANIGCALQIARELRRAGRAIPVRHVVEVLAESYAREI